MKLMFKECECHFGELSRVPRTWWMRIFSSRRLYHCRKCESDVFANQRMVEGSSGWQTTSQKMFFQAVTPPSRPPADRVQ